MRMYSDLCLMEKNQLELLARIVLPSEILDYFEITSVEQTSTEIRIHLDELMNAGLSADSNFESKGFMDIACKGTRYSKEFGAFLKETYGDIPGDLPYA